MTWLTPGAVKRAEATRDAAPNQRQARDPQCATLQALLPEQEATFVEIFTRLDRRTQKRLARESGIRGLLPAALATDSADAVLAMRPFAKQRWQLGFNAYSNARLAELTRRTRQPNLSAAMHQIGAVDDATLLMALQHAPVETLLALVTAGRVPLTLLDASLTHFAGRLPRETLRTWLAHQRISLPAYLRATAPERSVEQAAMLLEEVAAQEIDARQTLRYLNLPWEQILTWLESSLLAGKYVLDAYPELAQEKVRALLVADYIDIDDFIATGHATDDELVEFVKSGDIAAATCMDLCAVSEAVASNWLEHRKITEAQYLQKRGEHWLRHEPVSQIHVRLVKCASDIHATLLALPAPQDATLRHSMRVRLYAEWIRMQTLAGTSAPSLWNRPITQLSVLLSIGSGAAAQLGRLGGLVTATAATIGHAASSLIWGSVGRAPEAAEAPTCFACMEPFDAAHPAITLDGCRHPAILHAECLRADFAGRMQQGYPARCPVVEGGRPTSMAGGLAMGLDADALDALAMSIIRPYRPEFWANCPTDGCVAGAAIAPRHGLQRDCALCEQRVDFSSLDKDLQQSRDVMLEMIAGMADAFNVAQTRPCYHCGTATLRVDGCNTMECGRDAHTRTRVQQQGCGHTWNFISGVHDHAGWAANAGQCFVPRNGEMLRAGLFDPLPPGFLHRRGEALPGGHPTLQALAQGNARRLGWLP